MLSMIYCIVYIACFMLMLYILKRLLLREADGCCTEDHIDRRILQSGSKAQERGDSRNYGFAGSLCSNTIY